jgi:DNA-binding transcriptional LysR family regulator
MTQGAVSRQVAILEEYLNVKLFERINRRLILTEAGRDYAAQVSTILKQIEMATFQVMTYNSLASVLNLAILPTFGVKWLIPRLAKFAAAYPDVLLNLSTEVLPFDFNTRQVDAAIHFGEPDWPDTVMVRLMGEEVVPVCSKALAEGLGSVGTWPTSRCSSTTRPQAWQDWFRHVGVDCPNALSGPRFEQLAMVIQAAVAGMGVALMPKFMVETEISLGQLHVPFPWRSRARNPITWSIPRRTPARPPSSSSASGSWAKRRAAEASIALHRFGAAISMLTKLMAAVCIARACSPLRAMPAAAAAGRPRHCGKRRRGACGRSEAMRCTILAHPRAFSPGCIPKTHDVVKFLVLTSRAAVLILHRSRPIPLHFSREPHVFSTHLLHPGCRPLGLRRQRSGDPFAA